jgi:hypothetical protein
MTKEIKTFTVGDRLANTFNVTSVDGISRALTLTIIDHDGNNVTYIRPNAERVYAKGLQELALIYTNAASARFAMDTKEPRQMIILAYDTPAPEANT